MKKVLTIAGSDCSGGAGIQADLKTMSAHRVYGMSVITALTAQNTLGISGVVNVSGEFVAKQISAVFEDIYPDAVKIGMLPNVEVMQAVAEALKKYKVKNVVLDPVLASTSGTELSASAAREYLIKDIFPLCRIVTPNIPEAQMISKELQKSKENKKFTDIDSAEKAEGCCEFISEATGCSVLLKGGHSSFNIDGKVADLLCVNEGSGSRFLWISGDRYDNPNTHGTGCTLSSAIACNIALGNELEESVKRAKKYVGSCINAGLDLGHGRGPMEHVIVTEN